MLPIMVDLFTDTTPKATDYSAKDIEVLEGLEPVRKRPGMYIGGIDDRAYHHLATEILDNSIDEVVSGYASLISVHLSADGRLTITDNGRGIPVDPQIIAFFNKTIKILNRVGRFGNKLFPNLFL